MDWDDEDEKTTVYEKGGDEDAARALLRSAPPPAAGRPAPPTSSAPPAPRALTPAGRVMEATDIRPRPSSRPPPRPNAPVNRKLVIALLASAAVAVLAAVLILFKPFTSGSLLVTVAGPGNKAIEAVEIGIEDETGTIAKKCLTSPCTVPKLKSGLYLVKVKAAGYEAPAPEAVPIDTGANVVKRITLAMPSKGTGVRVSAKGAGPFRLTIDDKDQGVLPASISDLEPGQHTIRISDKKDRYEPFEQQVTLAKGEMVELSPTLKVVRALAKITAGPDAEGARVALVSGSERRPLPKIPIAIEIKLDKPYTLVATKAGYPNFELPLTFDDGEAEKTFKIVLGKKGAAAEAAAPAEPPASQPAPTPRGSRKAPSTPKSGPLAPFPGSEGKGAGTATGTGTIAINSIPIASVMVDGKALGNTPTSWSGPAGTHTITFSHPEHGRKSQTVTVKPGAKSVVAVRFP